MLRHDGRRRAVEMVQEGCGERRCLSLIDGASALHARNEPVFVQRAEVGRW